MTWINFVALWETQIGTAIPQDAIRQWQKFVKESEDGKLEKSVRIVAEKYFATIDKGVNKYPVLAQLYGAYNDLLNAEKLASGHSGCEFCKDLPGSVYVLDPGEYGSDIFPPDPDRWQGRRAICVVPCPCCRANEYTDQAMREKVRRFSRPFCRRNELLRSTTTR